MKRILWGGLGLIVLAAALFLVPTIWFKPWSIDHFYARVFVRFALRHPELLTSIGVLDGTPFDGCNGQLDDYSLAGQAEDLRFVTRQLAILRRYDRSRMTPQQLLSCQVLEWFLADQVEGARFQFDDYPVNQLFGVQNGLPDFMINTHPLKRPRDAENYLKRVAQFPRVIDETIEGLRERERRHVVPPRFVLAEVLTEMRGFTGKPAPENPLYANFDTKTAAIAKLAPGKRQELLKRLAASIETGVYPAYGRLIDYCVHLDSVATDDDGVWKLPDGAAYYAYRLKSVTTTDLSADTLHAIGLREVDRIQAEMKGILAAQGYATTDLAATMTALSAEPRFHYAPATPGARASWPTTRPSSTTRTGGSARSSTCAPRPACGWSACRRSRRPRRPAPTTIRPRWAAPPGHVLRQPARSAGDREVRHAAPWPTTRRFPDIISRSPSRRS